METMKWEDLSQRQKYLLGTSSALELGLKLAAWHYLYHDPKEKIRGNKWAWFAATFINFFGPIAFLIFGRKRK